MKQKVKGKKGGKSISTKKPLVDRRNEKVDSLIAVLQRPDSETQEILGAIRELRKIKDPKSIWPLIGVLDNPDADVELFASSLLVELKAVDQLIIALGDVWCRESAARILGEIGDRKAVEALLYYLDDGSKRVREDVAIVLGRLKDTRAVEALIRRSEDEDLLVRKAAVGALGNMDDPRVIEPLIKKLREMWPDDSKF